MNVLKKRLNPVATPNLEGSVSKQMALLACSDEMDYNFGCFDFWECFESFAREDDGAVHANHNDDDHS